MKLCKKCGIAKGTIDFSKRAAAKDRLQHFCKKCFSEIRRQLKYGRTPEDLIKLIESQAGRCVICREVFTDSFNTHIDHVHGSDPVVVRGILCSQCNVGLGNFKDSPERLLNAAAYLKKFQK